MKLRTKLILTTFFVFLIAFAFIGMLVFSNSKANLEHQVQHQLESISQITVDNINTFLDAQEKKISLIANQQDLSNEELGQMVADDDSFYDLFVINSEGIVTASSNPERIGLNRKDRCYFFNAINQSATCPVYFALVPKEYSVSVSTPFHGGVLVGSIKISALNEFVSERTGLGETGESLLGFVDETGSAIYFSPRRFSNVTIEVLSLDQIKDRPLGMALEGKHETFSDKLDYRGVRVLASTNSIERINVGLVTKMDLSEASASVYRLQNMTLFLVAITSILIIIILFILSRQISKEIEEITGEIDAITRGNLEVQLRRSSTFEIQKLIDSLNRILASMKLAILRTGISKSDMGIGEVMAAKKEAEDKYKILYETSSRAIMTLEPPSWKFTNGNPAAVKMFNLKDENELKTLLPSDLSPKLQPNGRLSSVKAKQMIMRAMKDGGVQFKWTHKRHKGEEFPAEVLLTKMKIDGKDVVQAMVTDLSGGGK